MKKIIAVCITVIFYSSMTAQYVGVGTATPSRSLHIVDSNNHTTVLVESPSAGFDKDVSVELKQPGGSSDWLRLKKYSLLSSEVVSGVPLGGTSTLFSGIDAGNLIVGALNGSSGIDFFAGGRHGMFLAPTGRLKIGIGYLPQAPLHVQSDTYEAARIQGPNAAITFWDDVNLRGYIQAWTDALGISSSAGNHLRLYSNQGANERLTILANGNVGINNNNPQANLHIGGSTVELVRIQGTNPAQTFYNGNNYVGYLQGFGTVMELASQGSNRLGLFTSGTERLTVLPNGNTGINNNAPNATLDINGFTRLGAENEGAPKIKTKLLQTIMPANNSTSSVLIGIDAGKVVDFNAMLTYSINGAIYYWPLKQSQVSLKSQGGINTIEFYTDSPDYAGLPVKIFLTYIE